MENFAIQENANLEALKISDNGQPVLQDDALVPTTFSAAALPIVDATDRYVECCGITDLYACRDVRENAMGIKIPGHYRGFCVKMSKCPDTIIVWFNSMNAQKPQYVQTAYASYTFKNYGQLRAAVKCAVDDVLKFGA